MVNRRIVTAIPISAMAYEPYGALLDASSANPRLNFTVDLDNPRDQARPNLALIRTQPAAFPLEVVEMERHPFSVQVFIPLVDTDYFIVVARDDGQGRPDLATLVAFTVPQGLAISYSPDTWHTGMASLHRAGRFAMVIHEDGSKDDCIFKEVVPFQVVLGGE